MNYSKNTPRILSRLPLPTLRELYALAGRRNRELMFEQKQQALLMKQLEELIKEFEKNERNK